MISNYIMWMVIEKSRSSNFAASQNLHSRLISLDFWNKATKYLKKGKFTSQTSLKIYVIVFQCTHPHPTTWKLRMDTKQFASISLNQPDLKSLLPSLAFHTSAVPWCTFLFAKGQNEEKNDWNTLLIALWEALFKGQGCKWS